MTLSIVAQESSKPCRSGCSPTFPTNLNNLEIPCQFPIRDVLPELALFPLARRCEMLHESVAEPLARHPRLLESLSGLPQRPRQRQRFGELVVVRVAFDERLGLDALLDA